MLVSLGCGKLRSIYIYIYIERERERERESFLTSLSLIIENADLQRRNKMWLLKKSNFSIFYIEERRENERKKIYTYTNNIDK